MKMTFEIGDRYDDGHGKFIVVNVCFKTEDTRKIRNANKSLKDIGLDFNRDICSEYEDSRLSHKVVKIMEEQLSLDMDELMLHCDKGEDSLYVYGAHGLASIYIMCLNAIDSDLGARITSNEFMCLNDYVDSIGYGVIS